MTPEELEALRLEEEAKKAEEAKKETKDEFVARKDYLEVSKSMHKHKSKSKDLEAKIAKLEADANTRNEQDLADKEQWQTLAEERGEKIKEITDLWDTDRVKFLDKHKKQAVIDYVGGFIKPEYSNMIIKPDLIDDEITAESVKAHGDDIIQNHPNLLKKSENASLPNEAANTTTVKDKKVDLSKMNDSEKRAYFNSFLKANNE